jgi:hypothetical protein
MANTVSTTRQLRRLRPSPRLPGPFEDLFGNSTPSPSDPLAVRRSLLRPLPILRFQRPVMRSMRGSIESQKSMLIIVNFH